MTITVKDTTGTATAATQSQIIQFKTDLGIYDDIANAAGTGNIDGGHATTNYGGIPNVDGGGA